MSAKVATNPKNTSAEQVAVTSAVASTKPEINKTANKKASEATLPANDINNLVVAPAPNASTPAPVNTKTTPASGAGWSVNLASSNQLADAKKTAESYAQKGIPVTITPITVKNETRYRIQVKGFKNKEEAAAYAAKAKDALKLNSVWINP
jgi:cell division septation protein DedD